MLNIDCFLHCLLWALLYSAFSVALVALGSLWCFWKKKEGISVCQLHTPSLSGSHKLSGHAELLGGFKMPHKMLSHSREDKELRWDFRHDLCVGDTLGSKSVFLFLQMSPSIGYAPSTHHWNHYKRHCPNLMVLEMNVKKSCYQKTQLVSSRRSGYNKTLQ